MEVEHLLDEEDGRHAAIALDDGADPGGFGGPLLPADVDLAARQPHEDDEVYVVLDGRGVLDVDGTPTPLEPGQAVFVPAGARHQFTGYDHLSVLVIFARRWRFSADGGHRLPV